MLKFAGQIISNSFCNVIMWITYAYNVYMNPIVRSPFWWCGEKCKIRNGGTCCFASQEMNYFVKSKTIFNAVMFAIMNYDFSCWCAGHVHALAVTVGVDSQPVDLPIQCHPKLEVVLQLVILDTWNVSNIWRKLAYTNFTKFLPQKQWPSIGLRLQFVINAIIINKWNSRSISGLFEHFSRIPLYFCFSTCQHMHCTGTCLLLKIRTHWVQPWSTPQGFLQPSLYFHKSNQCRMWK